MKAKQPFVWFVAGLLLAAACGALGAPQTFGTRTLEIPDPQGFVPVSAASPRFIELAQAYLPPGNRLIEVYTTPADHQVFAAGGGKDLDRYLQVQTLRSMEGRPLSNDEFREASQEMEAQLAQTFAHVNDQAAELLQKGNAAVKAKAGVDPNIGASDFGYLGAYRREPWGLFFSMSTRVSTSTAEPRKMICSGALTLIDHQLVFLYAYATFNSEQDKAWVQKAVSDWADAVRAANPDDPSLDAKAESLRYRFDWSRVGVGATIGAGLGALIGLLYVIIKRKDSQNKA